MAEDLHGVLMLQAAGRCDHRSWRGPAKHPLSAAAQEQGQEGRGGIDALAVLKTTLTPGVLQHHLKSKDGKHWL